MRQLYNVIEKMATMSPKLSYSHYVELLLQKDLNKVRYYIELVENNNLLVKKLRDRIKEESMMLEEIKLRLLTIKGKYDKFISISAQETFEALGHFLLLIIF